MRSCLLRYFIIRALALALIGWGSGSSADAAGLGRLLISLPDRELAQIIELDRVAPLAPYPDANAKGSRHDGGNRQYVKIRNTGFKQDSLTVYEAATGQVLYAAKVPRISEVMASAVMPGVHAFVFLDVASDSGLLAVVDLANEQRVLASDRGEVGQYLYWWMPDGSLARLHARTGDLATWRGSPQGANELIVWQPRGQVPLPLQGALFDKASLSPRGSELLLSTVEDRTRRGDLWMLDLTTGQMQRVTDDGFVSFVMWAPDGLHLLLRRDNVSHIGTTFQGQCSYWLAPRSARQVTNIVPGQPHAMLRQVLYDAGQHRAASLPCGQVSAWFGPAAETSADKERSSSP